jgi:hypothetical protein
LGWQAYRGASQNHQRNAARNLGGHFEQRQAGDREKTGTHGQTPVSDAYALQLSCQLHIFQ